MNQQERRPEESLKAYHARLKAENDRIREHLRGRLVHVAKELTPVTGADGRIHLTVLRGTGNTLNSGMRATKLLIRMRREARRKQFRDAKRARKA